MIILGATDEAIVAFKSARLMMAYSKRNLKEYALRL